MPRKEAKPSLPETDLSHWPPDARESVLRLRQTRAALSSLSRKLDGLVFVGGSVAGFGAIPDSDTDVVVCQTGERDPSALDQAFEVVAHQLRGLNSPYEVRLGPWQGEVLVPLRELRAWDVSADPPRIPRRLIATLGGFHRIEEMVLDKKYD